MTNGPGKSDRLTVPEKSSNNAGQPVAEGMEGKGLAKGNLPQQNASRTPSRTDAPSALERVRQAAEKDKKLRFTALLRHIYNLQTLHMAYFQVGRLWYRALSRRSQNGTVLWDRMRRLVTRWLPPATLCHPYPLRQMGVIT